MSKKDDIRLRLAGPDDLPQLADLRWRLKTDDSEDFDAAERAQFVAAFTELLADTDGQCRFFHWVADLNGQLVAVMSILKVKQLPSPTQIDGYWGYLTNCYVMPPHRNRGVGADLLTAVKRWAKEQKLELLLVWPSDRSYAFYERSGFHRYSDPLVLKLDDDGQ